jgi:hypothetical protein
LLLSSRRNRQLKLLLPLDERGIFCCFYLLGEGGSSCCFYPPSEGITVSSAVFTLWMKSSSCCFTLWMKEAAPSAFTLWMKEAAPAAFTLCMQEAAPAAFTLWMKEAAPAAFTLWMKEAAPAAFTPLYEGGSSCLLLPPGESGSQGKFHRLPDQSPSICPHLGEPRPPGKDHIGAQPGFLIRWEGGQYSVPAAWQEKTSWLLYLLNKCATWRLLQVEVSPPWRPYPCKTSSRPCSSLRL